MWWHSLAFTMSWHLSLRSLLEPSLNTFYDFVHLTPASAAIVAKAAAAATIHRGVTFPQKCAQCNSGNGPRLTRPRKPGQEHIEFWCARCLEIWPSLW